LSSQNYSKLAFFVKDVSEENRYICYPVENSEKENPPDILCKEASLFREVDKFGVIGQIAPNYANCESGQTFD